MVTETNDDEILKLQNKICGLLDTIDGYEKELSGKCMLLSVLSGDGDISTEVKAHVSDHAILRYFERHYKVDIDKVRSDILTPNTVEAIHNGANTVKINGISFVVKDGVIVTALFTRDVTKKRNINADKYGDNLHESRFIGKKNRGGDRWKKYRE